jgi:hypothetical protein
MGDSIVFKWEFVLAINETGAEEEEVKSSSCCMR